MSKVLRKFIDNTEFKSTWWLILECSHWYHWTGDIVLNIDNLNCPSCERIVISKVIEENNREENDKKEEEK